MTGEQRTTAAADGTTITLTRWPGDGPSVVLLHANVADRRAWTAVGDLLAADGLDVVTWDRRGFGDTPAGGDATHVQDLVAVLDGQGIDRAVLVGNSMGGAIALDTALLHPDRVTGVLLVGAAVSGMTDEDAPFDWELDPASAPLVEALERLEASDDPDVEAQLPLLAHLWLDGPAAPEGRVGEPARSLFAAMNRRIAELGAPDRAGDAGLDAWTRLGEIAVPVVTAWGALDVPADVPLYEETARRIGRGPGVVVPDVAHLPGLEQPERTAELVRTALRTIDAG